MQPLSDQFVARSEPLFFLIYYRKAKMPEEPNKRKSRDQEPTKKKLRDRYNEARDNMRDNKLVKWAQENRVPIGIGVGGVTFGFLLRGKAAHLAPTFNNTVSPEMTNVVNTIVLPAYGDPGDVVQNLRTLETYASKGELARRLGVSRSTVAKYFAGELPNLFDDQYKVVGKAGHAVRLA